MTQQPNFLPATESQRLIVLYDGETGSVEHIHVVRVYPGGRAVSDNEAVATARKQAARTGRESDQWKAVASSDMSLLNGPITVDVQTERIIPKEQPESSVIRLQG